jgi:hypothetical protein
MTPDRIDLDDAGLLDDVSIAATHVRLERMNEGAWWLKVERPGKPALVVWLATKRPSHTMITPTVTEEPA